MLVFEGACILINSSKHNSVAITPRASGATFRDPRFNNVHGKRLYSSTVLACPLALTMLISPVLPPFAVAAFCVVAANKNKAQERLIDLKKRIG